MLRLYIEREHWAGNRVTVPSAQLAHLRARRIEVGEAVCVFNGDGNDAFGHLTALGKRDAVIEIDRTVLGLGFATPEITLALSIIANDRMDWAVQKATELGVAAIVPVMAQRSQLAHLGEKKRPHWQGVAVSAAEQSGRAQVATIRPAMSLAAALAQASATDADALFTQMGAAPIRLRHPMNRSAMIFVGPEGGWTADELTAFAGHGAHGVGLGHATLRAETAALAAIANLIPS